MTDKTIILDTPDQIEMFHLLAAKYALRIEVATGLRHSQGSVLKKVNELLMRNGRITRPCRTKVMALNALQDYIDEKEQAMRHA